ncbi:MAG: 23S rRNA (adenine(2030)-N(6))-methyltransferase RlmJ [Reyranellaceae bacterium]
MNYRHAFHAGNFADVLKHAALALALELLAAKDKPFLVLDTHAGRGRYDLAREATRTGEWQDGIGRLLQAQDRPAELKRYTDIVRGFNRRLGGTGEALLHYPGSPRLVRALLRPGDRLVACELHDEDGLALRREFAGDPQVEVKRSDGYAALKALLPPPERRGLVLIDPPFEARDEFDRLQRALLQALRRFATGTYLIWYPVKDAPAVAGFKAFLARAQLKRTLTAELEVPARTAGGLRRAGVALVNAPWPIEDGLAATGPFLARALGGRDGAFDLDWIARD